VLNWSNRFLPTLKRGNMIAAVARIIRYVFRFTMRTAVPPVGSRALVRLLGFLSDSLTSDQQTHLQTVFHLAIEQYIDGHVDVARLVRGIAVVVVEESEVEDFVSGVLATLSEDGFIVQGDQANNNRLGLQSAGTPVDYAKPNQAITEAELEKAVCAAVHEFGIEPERLQALPDCVIVAIYERLTRCDARQAMSCPISMDSLVDSCSGNFLKGTSIIVELPQLDDKMPMSKARDSYEPSSAGVHVFFLQERFSSAMVQDWRRHQSADEISHSCRIASF